MKAREVFVKNMIYYAKSGNRHDVINHDNPSEVLDNFWSYFSALYELNLPQKRFDTKINRNIHPINAYMTNELFASRTQKSLLHKLSLTIQTEINISTYRKNTGIFTTRLSNLAKTLLYNEPQTT
jgi:hypothetical protein